LVLLIPFYFVSWWIEYLVMKRMLKNVDKLLLRKTVGKMNFISYSGLALYVLCCSH
jgi:hypothetical protein